MDFLQRLGGRKFLMAIVIMVVGALIELKTERGLSPTYAGLLGTLFATFSAANFGVSREHLKSRANGDADGVSEKVDRVIGLIENSSDQENVKVLVTLLQNIDRGITEVKATSLQVGQAMVNVNSEIGRIKQRLQG